MLSSNAVPIFLFVINPASGNNSTNWSETIEKYCNDRAMNAVLFPLPEDCNPDIIRKKIDVIEPAKVIAVGGDGTVKLVAEALMHSGIPLGILPAGSANGMAKEFDIPDDAEKALKVIETGRLQQIHLVNVNDQICIHLADIGFNAYVVKKFEEDNTRGMWGYMKAAWKVIWQHSRMQVSIKTDSGYITRDAAMVVIANGTKYGNGVVINPLGTLSDKLFEVVVIRKVSFTEIFKMRFFSTRLNQQKTELLQTSQLKLKCSRNLYFQVDGEYLGKIKKLSATVIPDAIQMIVPVTV